MIKLIAFDWNGTLLSDTMTIVRADREVLKRFNRPAVTLTKFRQSFCVPIADYWKKIGFPDKEFKKHAKEIDYLFQKNYEPLADKTRSRAGVKNVLQWLNENNTKSCIYSNHTTPNIHRVLKRLKMEKLISKVLARDLGDITHMHVRGKEQKLVDFVKTLKLKPKEVISVGDTEEEIEIGKKHGFHTVAITGGYNTTARLKKHNPDFLIHNMLELKNIVKKLNSNK
jgi:phosphoglycolate phosphatase-like HAD superfamily hydrolase